MATFVSLIKLTEQGVKQFKDTCKRATDFKANAKKLGVEVKSVYWCLGAFDGVVILEAPDDETATASLLQLGSMNYVTTQTLRSFTAEEMTKILAKVP
jgi:uncharacterized protein with GYD domain